MAVPGLTGPMCGVAVTPGAAEMALPSTRLMNRLRLGPRRPAPWRLTAARRRSVAAPVTDANMTACVPAASEGAEETAPLSTRWGSRESPGITVTAAPNAFGMAWPTLGAEETDEARPREMLRVPRGVVVTADSRDAPTERATEGDDTTAAERRAPKLRSATGAAVRAALRPAATDLTEAADRADPAANVLEASRATWATKETAALVLWPVERPRVGAVVTAAVNEERRARPPETVGDEVKETDRLVLT